MVGRGRREQGDLRKGERGSERRNAMEARGDVNEIFGGKV